MKATKDTEIKIKVDIKPWSMTPAARKLWDTFWRRLTTEAKQEVKQ